MNRQLGYDCLQSLSIQLTIVTCMQYRFDNFILDTDRFELLKNGATVHAEPQVLELLLFMIENRGRLISKEELNQSVWKGRIVSDSALSSRIKIARRLLGDDGRKQQYIRTIYKKGFSFVAEVQQQPSNHVASGACDQILKNDNYNRLQPSIVILPFTSRGDNPEYDIFASGITEDITITLSKISKLSLLTCSPSLNPADSMDVIDIGKKLGVDYILEGSIRIGGNRLRVSTNLVHIASGRHIWAEQYDRQKSGLFDLQDEITKEVVSALQVRLTEGDQALLSSRGTNNIEAWKLMFQGEASVLLHRQETVRRGLLQLEQAVRLDENYAQAWNGLATGHFKESMNKGWSQSAEASLTLALQASDRALALDPRSAATLATRSLIMVSFRDYRQAQSLAEQSLLHANNEAHTIALAAITLRVCCETEKSLAYTDRAMRLCPLYPAWYPYGNSVCYWMMKDYTAAFRSVKEAIEIDPGFIYSYFLLAMAYAETGQSDPAADAVKNILRIDPGFSRKVYTDAMPFRDDDIEMRRERALTAAGL